MLIQESLRDIAKEKTIILIAHRLSTVIEADIIYVLDNGNIVEKGNHKELLNSKGHYYDLWSLQTGKKIMK